MPSETFKTFFEEDQKKIRIFLDMDGCLVDFDKSFKKYNDEELSADDYEAKYGKNAFWEVIVEAGEEFWVNMEWMDDGKQLWNATKPFNPIILSAPSNDDHSKMGKAKWLKKNIPELANHYVQTKARRGWDGVSHIILNNLKFRYATGPSDILIDDKSDNINKWNEAGGTGILHTSTAKTLQDLKKILS